MALGEIIEEAKGVITGQRVLEIEGPKIETSQKLEGKFGGVAASDMGTYCTVMRGEEMYGEGQGVITAKDGQGMATWTGQGIGRFTGPGKISFRGSVFFRIPSTFEGGKLSDLNNMVGMFEYELDEAGNCSVKTWEWK